MSYNISSEAKAPVRSRRLSLSHCTDAVKLDVSKFQLYHNEKRTLLDTWARLTVENRVGNAEVIIVHGNASTGKNVFVNSLRRYVENSGGVVLAGNFADVGSNQPYSAISDAIIELCLLRKRQMDFENFIDLINKNLSEDISSLKRQLPKFESLLQFNEIPNGRRRSSGNRRRASTLLLPNENETDESKSMSNLRSPDLGTSVTTNARASTCIIRQIVRLFNSLTNSYRPILFAIENLHLADGPSLNLFSSLISDECEKNVLFIGTYNDDYQGHVNLSKESFASNHFQWKTICTYIHLKEMSVHEVNQLVAVTTGMSPMQTFDLSNIIWAKTGGKFYLVTQFLELLQEQNLLLYSLKTNGWVWDISRIQSETEITDDVADIIVRRIQHLDDSVQSILKISSCLGSQFEFALVALIMAAEESKASNIDNGDKSNRVFDLESIDIPVSFDTTKMEEDFQYLCHTGLLEAGNCGLSKFSHEKVHQASYALIPEGRERDELHLRIGRLLCEIHKDPTFQEEWVFFAAVNQFNKASSSITDEEDILEVIHLNMDAAELAIIKSAFMVASKYLSQGIALIQKSDRDYWGSHYELCLELYSTSAEMEQCAGNFEKCLTVVNEVFKHGRNLKDKFQAYFVKIQMLGSHGSLADAMDTGANILRDLGVQIPKAPRVWHVKWETVKTRNILRGRSDESIISGSRIRDRNHLMIVGILHLLSMYCHVWQDSAFLSIVFLRSLQCSLLFGISEYTPYSLANFGVILARSGDISEAFRFADLAVGMLDGVCEQSKSEVLFVLHSYLFHWRYPLRSSLDPLMRSYDIAMGAGSVEIALSAADAYASVYIAAGLPLSHVASDMRRFKKQTVEYRLETVEAVMAPSLQFILNLMGESQNVTSLTGEAMNEESLVKAATISGNRIALRAIFRFRLLLATYFEESFEEASLFDNLPEDEISCHYGKVQEAFACALLFISKYRSMRKRHFVRQAKKFLHFLLKWIKAGNINCHDLLLLLQAEMKSIEKASNSKEIREAYDKSIASSSRSGYVHNAGLASEKAAYFFASIADSFWFQHYLQKAHAFYREWNAWGKVRDLEIKYPFLLSQNREAGSVRSGSLQGRTRFNPLLQGKHEKISYNKSSQDQIVSGRRRSIAMQREYAHSPVEPDNNASLELKSVSEVVNARKKSVIERRRSMPIKASLNKLESLKPQRRVSSPSRKLS
jgi:predicted ATPase